MGKHRPDIIVKNMYLEITNLAQGVNLAALLYVITVNPFPVITNVNDFSPYLYAICSFFIIITFWIRYYFDTQILERSFTVFSAFWFFSFVSIQGVTTGFIFKPYLWLASSSIFLFFAAGFYWLNLREIKRKTDKKSKTFKKKFIRWQRRRMAELLMLSLLSIPFSIIVKSYPSLSFVVGSLALGFSIWQLLITGDYRNKKFIKAGL